MTGTLPTRMRGATVRVSHVRTAASSPLDLDPVPARLGTERDKVLLANHRKANQFEVVSDQIASKGTAFALRLEVPEKLPNGRLSLRVGATTGEEVVIRVQSLEVVRRGE